ncbi:MAG: NADPH-dependent FMN reductase [Segetibacter sp.]
MEERKRVLAISGSTRKASTNLNLINAIAALTATKFDIQIYQGLALLPHFNPDLDTDNPPASVSDFKKLIREADGVLICTPEYAMGVPGTLKNALDWTVSSCEFSHKPVALITASTSGEKAHASLLGTLNVIEAKIGKQSQLLIQFAKTKVNDKNAITDNTTLTSIKELIDSFIDTMNQEEK